MGDAGFARLGRLEEARARVVEVKATFDAVVSGEAEVDPRQASDAWLLADPTMFDVAPRLSETVLRFVVFLKTIRPMTASVADTDDAVDWEALRRGGIIPKGPFDTGALSCAGWMEVLAGLLDGWGEVCEVRGVGRFVTGLVYRLSRLAFDVHTPDVADDVRFYSELDGIAKRIKEEDAVWDKRMVRKQMALCTPHELAEEPAALLALTSWRAERHLRPTVQIITFTEPALRDVLMQLRLLAIRVPVRGGRTERVLQRASLRTMGGANTRLLMADRMTHEFARLLAPGDHERYRRQCPLLAPLARPILQLYRPMRCVIPAEKLAAIMADPMDPASAVTLARRAVGDAIALTHAFERISGPSLRFVGHKLACVTAEACYVADEGVSPYAVVAKFMGLAGIATPVVEGEDADEEREAESNDPRRRKVAMMM